MSVGSTPSFVPFQDEPSPPPSPSHAAIEQMGIEEGGKEVSYKFGPDHGLGELDLNSRVSNVSGDPLVQVGQGAKTGSDAKKTGVGANHVLTPINSEFAGQLVEVANNELLTQFNQADEELNRRAEKNEKSLASLGSINKLDMAKSAAKFLALTILAGPIFLIFVGVMWGTLGTPDIDAASGSGPDFHGLHTHLNEQKGRLGADKTEMKKLSDLFKTAANPEERNSFIKFMNDQNFDLSKFEAKDFIKSYSLYEDSKNVKAKKTEVDELASNIGTGREKLIEKEKFLTNDGAEDILKRLRFYGGNGKEQALNLFKTQIESKNKELEEKNTQLLELTTKGESQTEIEGVKSQIETLKTDIAKLKLPLELDVKEKQVTALQHKLESLGNSELEGHSVELQAAIAEHLVELQRAKEEKETLETKVKKLAEIPGQEHYFVESSGVKKEEILTLTHRTIDAHEIELKSLSSAIATDENTKKIHKAETQLENLKTLEELPENDAAAIASARAQCESEIAAAKQALMPQIEKKNSLEALIYKMQTDELMLNRPDWKPESQILLDLEFEIDVTDKKVAQTKHQLEKVQKDTPDNEPKIKELTDTKKTLSQKSEQLKASYTLVEELMTLKKSVDDVESQIKEAKAKVVTFISENKTGLAEIEGHKLEPWEKDKLKLKTDLESLKDNVKNLETKKIETEAKVNDFSKMTSKIIQQETAVLDNKQKTELATAKQELEALDEKYHRKLKKPGVPVKAAP